MKGWIHWSYGVKRHLQQYFQLYRGRPVASHCQTRSHNDGCKKWKHDSKCTLNVYSK